MNMVRIGGKADEIAVARLTGMRDTATRIRPLAAVSSAPATAISGRIVNRRGSDRSQAPPSSVTAERRAANSTAIGDSPAARLKAMNDAPNPHPPMIDRSAILLV